MYLPTKKKHRPDDIFCTIQLNYMIYYQEGVRPIPHSLSIFYPSSKNLVLVKKFRTKLLSTGQSVEFWASILPTPLIKIPY